MLLPDVVRQDVETVLGKPIKDVRPCIGGDINEAVQILTDDSTFFLKWNQRTQTNMFSAESMGLSLLASTKVLRVPLVIHVHDGDSDIPAYLILEWLETGTYTSTTMRMLGDGLAQLHKRTSEQHGLAYNNYIGSLPQYNQQHDNWVTFYAEKRIATQMDIARERGRLTSQRESALNTLINKLPHLLPADVKPSLLHGDLWRGNVMTLADGIPAIIDPAVYYGHFEVEIAFTELFGGFSADFYDAYWSNTDENRRDYQDRKFLYQLYPLMVHLNLFGEGYAPSVDAILNRYVD